MKVRSLCKNSGEIDNCTDDHVKSSAYVHKRIKKK